MKKYITTIILLVLFIGLIGFFYFFESDKEDKVAEEEQTAETYVVWELNRDGIEKIILEYNKKIIEIKKSDDGKYKVIKPYEMEASENSINTVIDALSYIEGKGEEIAYEDLADFGLVKPKAKVKLIFNDGSEREIIIGDETLSGMEVYAKTSDNDYIFITDKIILDNIKVKEEDLEEKDSKNSAEEK